MKQVTATVISNSEVMPRIYLIYLEVPQIAPAIQAGQFVMAHCGEKTILRRPLSVHLRDENKIALLFTTVGKGTAWLSQRKVGDNVDLLGPLGNGFSIQPNTHRLLLVAGGIGIAPLYLLAQDSTKKGYKVVLLYGTADSRQYPLSSEIETVVATEDGSKGQKGMITDFIPDYIDQADQVFACGPPPMYKTMHLQREKLLKAKPVQVALEVRMGCGFGVCYGCTVKTKNGLKLVCKDGPVFDLDDIIWDNLELL